MVRNPPLGSRILATAIVAAGLIVAGCGYRPVDARRAFGPDVRQIKLGMLENRTSEVGLQAMLADALQEEFRRRGVLEPVYAPRADGADLSLGGRILRVDIESNAFSSVGLTLEDRVTVVLQVDVVRTETQEPVFRRDELRYSERFLASADPQTYESNKDQALRRISSQFASQLHDELFQRF